MFFNILRVFTTYLLPFMNNFLKTLGNLLKYCEVQFILTQLLKYCEVQFILTQLLIYRYNSYNNIIYTTILSFEPSFFRIIFFQSLATIYHFFVHICTTFYYYLLWTNILLLLKL